MMGGPDSYGGLDGKGPMAIIDLQRREMIPLPGFQERLEVWKRTSLPKQCLLRRKPTLSVLNSFLSGKEGYFYDINRHEIVYRPRGAV